MVTFVMNSIKYLLQSLKEEDVYMINFIQHKESYILRLITLAHLSGKTLRVTDLLSNHDLGTTPTIQSYIRKLVLKEFIARKISDEDKRVQFLIPLDKAIILFEQLSVTHYDEKIANAL